MSVLKYKKKFGFLSSLVNRYKTDNKFAVIVTFIFLILISVSGIIKEFKYFIFLYFLVATFLSIRFKSLFIGFFLITLLTFQLLSPAKSYQIQIFRSGELENIDYRNGLMANYGVNLPNIFIFLSVLFMVVERFKRGGLFEMNKLKVAIFFPSLLFMIWGIGVCLTMSYIPAASLIWAMQTTEVFWVAFLLYYFFKFYPKYSECFYSILLFSVVLQFVISILQFVKGGGLGMPIENYYGGWFSRSSEETDVYFRVMGTFSHPNYFALAVATLIIIIFVRFIKHPSRSQLLILILGSLTLVLSQSRSIWIGFVMAVSLLYFIYKQQILLIFRKFYKKRYLVLFGLIFSFSSVVFIPRLLLSFNSTYVGAAIPGRIEMIKEGLDVLSVNPLLGYGVGTNAYILYQTKPSGMMAGFPYGVHMAALQFAIEYGIVGLVLFCAPFFYILRELVNQRIRSKGANAIHQDYFVIYTILLLVYFIFFTLQPFDINISPYLGICLGFGIISLYVADQ